MTAAAIQCPRCAGALQIDGGWAGQQVTCPLCQGLMTVPAAWGLAGDQSTGEVTPPPLPSDGPPLPPQCPPPLPPLSLTDVAISLPPLERTSHPAVSAPKSITLPSPDGGTVRVEDRPKVIGRGRSEVIIRRLAPEEKSSRRFWKNVILWAGCILLLLAVCYFLAQRG